MLIRACSKRTGRTMIPPPRTPWFTLPQPQPQAQVRLFGFPHAGGGTVFFRPWLAHTPPNIEWCLVALPGREQRLREPPVQRLEHLVALLAEAIIPFLSKPAVFWGHSMGAFVAFELARELVRRQHGGPVHLVVSGQRAPQRSAAPPPIHHLPEARLSRRSSSAMTPFPRRSCRSLSCSSFFCPRCGPMSRCWRHTRITSAPG